VPEKWLLGILRKEKAFLIVYVYKLKKKNILKMERWGSNPQTNESKRSCG